MLCNACATANVSDAILYIGVSARVYSVSASECMPLCSQPGLGNMFGDYCSTMLSLADGWFLVQPSPHFSMYKVNLWSQKKDYGYSHVNLIIRGYAAAVMRAYVHACKTLVSGVQAA